MNTLRDAGNGNLEYSRGLAGYTRPTSWWCVELATRLPAQDLDLTFVVPFGSMFHLRPLVPTSLTAPKSQLHVALPWSSGDQPSEYYSNPQGYAFPEKQNKARIMWKLVKTLSRSWSAGLSLHLWNQFPPQLLCPAVLHSSRFSLGAIHFYFVVQSLSLVWLFVTPWTAARQAPLSSVISQSLLKFTSIEKVMLSNHLTLCRPLLLLPSILPSIRETLLWVFLQDFSHKSS